MEIAFVKLLTVYIEIGRLSGNPFVNYSALDTKSNLNTWYIFVEICNYTYSSITYSIFNKRVV